MSTQWHAGKMPGGWHENSALIAFVVSSLNYRNINSVASVVSIARRIFMG
jgi:hypothetical protein